MKFWLFLLLILILPRSFYDNSILSADKPVPGFYNEVMKFSINVKGLSVGDILMRTAKTGDKYLQINAQVDTFDTMKSFYYISGKFGAMWDFKNKKSYMAYEDIYDGYTYVRRAYRYQDDNRVFVNKREVRFQEAGLPHNKKPKRDKSSQYYIDSIEFQDLLGVFYTLRSSGIIPKPGETYKAQILPAGVKKLLVIEVLGTLEKHVEALGGKRKLIHVKTGIASARKKPEGGNIFFNVSSALEMYFTADDDTIPVQIWAKVPLIQRADVVLTDYKQTGGSKR
jgi:hypothetical protein